MSYDIWLEGGSDNEVAVGDTGWNYTSNCAAMWRAAGIDLEMCDGLLAGACAEGLGAAIRNLEAWPPEKIGQFNPPNGWGSHETLVPALKELLEIFESSPDATVRVWC